MPKKGSTGPRSLAKAASPNERRDLSHNESSARIIKLNYSTSLGLITIARRRTIIAPSSDIGCDRFDALMRELKQVDDHEKLQGGSERMLAWILDAAHGKKTSAQGDLQRLCDAFESLTNPPRTWVAARATIVVANANPTWISDASTSMSDYRPSTGSNTNEFYERLEQNNAAEIEAVTAFPDARDPNRPFRYICHTEPAEDNWTEAVVHQTAPSPVIDDDIVHNVYVANRIILGDKTASFDKDALSKLHKAGFLIFGFEEFLKRMKTLN